jgi:hypothetical protein
VKTVKTLNARDKRGALAISPIIVCYTFTQLQSKSLMLLIMEVGVWKDVEVVGIGDVVRGLFARALV